MGAPQGRWGRGERSPQCSCPVPGRCATEGRLAFRAWRARGRREKGSVRACAPVCRECVCACARARVYVCVCARARVMGGKCERWVCARVSMPLFQAAPGALSPRRRRRRLPSHHLCSCLPTCLTFRWRLPEAPAPLTAVAWAAGETTCPPSWCQRTQEISQVASCRAAAEARGPGRAPPPAGAAGPGRARASSDSPSPDKAQRAGWEAELRSRQDRAEQKNAALFSQGKL